jgi:hypothetical protein
MDEAEREYSDVRGLLLAQCHNAYQQTGNPVFVWLALDWCSDRYWPRTEVPEWCAQYLFDAAAKFANLIYQSDSAAAVKPSPTWVLDALGLSQPGRNLFRNAKAAEVKMRLAKDYNIAVKTQMKASKAASLVKQAVGLPTSEDRSAHRVVAEGEKLSAGRHPLRRRRSSKQKVTTPPP